MHFSIGNGSNPEDFLHPVAAYEDKENIEYTVMEKNLTAIRTEISKVKSEGRRR